MNDKTIKATHDLLPSERRFLTAMQQLGYGRFEFLRIERGELVLDPWPSTVCNVKFCAANSALLKARRPEFELKKQCTEFFEFVRAVQAGEIRTLEVQSGLPFSMEIEHRASASEGRRG